MPLPADYDLIQREPKMAGLACVLDPESLAAWLHEQGQLRPNESLTATYARYKPQASCLVAYRTGDQDSPRHLYAVAYHQNGGTDNLTSTARFLKKSDGRGIIDEKRLLSVVFFPHDQQLTQLPHIHAAERLAEFAKADQASYRILSYQPLRRCISCIDVNQEPNVTLHCLLPQDYQHAKQAATYVPQLETLVTLQPLQHSDRHSTLAFPWFHGKRLSEFALHEQFEYVVRLGSGLGELHRHVAHRLPGTSGLTLTSQLQGAATMLKDLVPNSLRQIDKTASIFGGPAGSSCTTKYTVARRLACRAAVGGPK